MHAREPARRRSKFSSKDFQLGVSGGPMYGTYMYEGLRYVRRPDHLVTYMYSTYGLAVATPRRKQTQQGLIFPFFHRPDLPPAIRNFSLIPYQQPSCPPHAFPFPPWPPSTIRQYLFRPAQFPPRLQILLLWHIPKIRPPPSRPLQVLLWHIPKIPSPSPPPPPTL